MPYKDSEQQKAAQRQWYQDHKTLTKEKSRRKRQANRAWLNALKDRPCIDCHLHWPPYVMEFHHRDSTEKLGTVANMLLNTGRQCVLNEIAKCDLLCANCHRIRTHRRVTVGSTPTL